VLDPAAVDGSEVAAGIRYDAVDASAADAEGVAIVQRGHEAHLMAVFQGAVDATFAAFGIDATCKPASGDPVPVRVIARRPDTIVGFGDTRIHAETVTFEVRASDVPDPRPAISSSSVARPSSSRVSPSAAIPTGSCGVWVLRPA
jgi:hypothetical protein